MPAPVQETITSQDIFENGELPPAKILETRDSISSIDSDVSLSFDVPKEDDTANLGDLSDSASETGSGNGKDSGCEVTPEHNEEPPFTPPSEELSEKIVTQVEFYFSDANITKDAFLLKHVKRNKEGFVSLKLISSFKRVKHITKDWRVVAHALSRSKKLEINDAGTKLRRLEPLPQYDETTPSRTVVAVDMPIDKPTIENVAELFKNCGEIALIRILRPGNPIPADVRTFINKNPSLSGAVCALVEFVLSESARNALKMTCTTDNNDTTNTTSTGSLKVYELNCVPHPERKKRNVKSKVSNNKDAVNDFTTNESDDKLRKLRRGSSAHFPSKNFEPAAWLQRRLSASSTEANFLYMPRRLSYGSRDSSEGSVYSPRRVSACSLSGSESNSSYFGRRMSSCSQVSDISSPGSRSRSNSSAFQAAENTVRMPKGPDGSRGFQRRPSTLASN